MPNSLEDRRKALEENYFEKQQLEAIKRMNRQKSLAQPRMSPVSGQPMELITVNSIAVHRCKESGGIFLDAESLEDLSRSSKTKGTSFGSWVAEFFAGIKAGRS